MNTRHTKILDIVNQEKKIEVNKLSDILNVSPVTIRKDLDNLENKGLLKREHGYAVICNTDDIGNRLSIKYDIKQKIAKLASEFVREGETIMIESGSSCALLARELSKSDKDNTIITNSAFIANYVKKSGAKIILLGGEYQKDSQVVVGPLVKACAKGFRVDKFFIGTDGFDPENGFLSKDMMRTETVKSMAECASNVIVLTDSTKFSKSGVVEQFKFNEVQSVITDPEIPVESKRLLEINGVRVITTV